MTQKIKITWKAFGDKPEIWRFSSSVEIETEFPENITHDQICEIIYADTNQYQGYTWNMIQPKLSETRTHTALSIGDEVEIDGTTYVVADFGFVKKEEAEIKMHGDVTFSVTKRKAVGV